MYRTVVTDCTAQWSLNVPHNGHWLYRTVVTECTAQWSLNVPHSGHWMYRTVVTERTAQWSLTVPHSGHWLYRTAVTECTAQRSLNVPSGLTFNNSPFCPHSVFMCFVWIWEQTAIISLYSINWLVCITKSESVYCAVRSGSLNVIQVNTVSTFTVRWMHKTGKKAVLFDNGERIVLSPVANFQEVTAGEVSIQKVIMRNSKPTAGWIESVTHLTRGTFPSQQAVLTLWS